MWIAKADGFSHDSKEIPSNLSFSKSTNECAFKSTFTDYSWFLSYWNFQWIVTMVLKQDDDKELKNIYFVYDVFWKDIFFFTCEIILKVLKGICLFSYNFIV